MGIAGAPRRKGAGRPPKPTALKIAEGNPGRRALNLNEPKYEVLDHLTPPASLAFSKFARQKWDYLVVELTRNEVLTRVDVHVLETFCYWLGIWHDAAKQLRTEGMTVEGQRGGLVQHPCIAIASKASGLVAQYGSLLGLDPSSRQRLIGPAPKNAEDKFTRILNGD